MQHFVAHSVRWPLRGFINYPHGEQSVRYKKKAVAFHFGIMQQPKSSQSGVILFYLERFDSLNTLFPMKGI